MRITVRRGAEGDHTFSLSLTCLGFSSKVGPRTHGAGLGAGTPHCLSPWSVPYPPQLPLAPAFLCLLKSSRNILLPKSAPLDPDYRIKPWWVSKLGNWIEWPRKDPFRSAFTVQAEPHSRLCLMCQRWLLTAEGGHRRSHWVPGKVVIISYVLCHKKTSDHCLLPTHFPTFFPFVLSCVCRWSPSSLTPHPFSVLRTNLFLWEMAG